ncbi:MAG: hypothetical protein H6551_05635 [Chitinophagales bacterium]|nr:hypothetical protein [Chitinophagaceae bacterium]MCB9064612.1 hypothetical protein [Chitinophagales bacterium]
MKYSFKGYILLTILPLMLISCGEQEKAPDVSNIEVAMSSRRLDKDMYEIDTNNIAQGLMKLEQRYPEFLPFYLDTLMGFGVEGNYTEDNNGIQKGVKTFLTHKDYRGVFDTVLARYPETGAIEEELRKGFKYLKFYLPDSKVPDIIYFVSGLNNYGAITYGSNTLAIGLDMFLGADYPFYKSVAIPEYFSRQLNQNYIPVAVFRTLYREKHPFIVQDKVLLDMMIQSGKEMYFVDKVLPFVPEEVRLAYTAEQLKWCKESEPMIYDFFIRQNLLYENKLQKVVRYVMEGPSATGMPLESPGNIGAWLGLQIVKSYMKQHPEMSLSDLMKVEVDAQQFLHESKYKPK